jgi:hypothetical protein
MFVACIVTTLGLSSVDLVGKRGWGGWSVVQYLFLWGVGKNECRGCFPLRGFCASFSLSVLPNVKYGRGRVGGGLYYDNFTSASRASPGCWMNNAVPAVRG